MTRVSDLSGDYGAIQDEVTRVAGARAMSIKSHNNNVIIDLKSNTQGVGLGFGGHGMSIKLAEPIVNASAISAVFADKTTALQIALNLPI
jgi:hypothetical protein